MVKYGPEIEAATCFENNSLEFKSEMLLQFTEILLVHDFDCPHDADRHDRVDFSIFLPPRPHNGELEKLRKLHM